jgi:DNA-binding MarR family transcriptional regulator
MTEDHIISILILRRARDEIFGSSLFAEPAWDVLLELYAAGLGGRRMSLRDIALAIKIPESTAARWVAALADHGLVSAHADPNQPIMPWLALTERGAAQMKQLADHWRSAFLSI